MSSDAHSELPADAPTGELHAQPGRQAIPAYTGFLHQLWWSVDAWLRLETADDVIYLEGAEDVDQVGPTAALSIQIKHEVTGLSLNTRRAREVLENFWTLTEHERDRRVDFHYVSTAPISIEQDNVFGGRPGLEVWRAAQTSLPKAELLQTYLVSKLDLASPLRTFLQGATAAEVQHRVIRRLHWFLKQPGVGEVVASVDDRITVRLASKNLGLSLVRPVRDRLYAHVSEVILRKASGQRRINLAELIREFDTATTAHVAIPVAMQQQLLALLASGALDPGDALLRFSRLPLPQVPSPVLSRPQVVALARSLIEERNALLLTGTVHKGKTTIAQLLANELCPDAWWFSVSSRAGVETDRLLRALASAVDAAATPSVIIIDDVDLSPGAYSSYCQALALVISRATRSGRGLVLTARGGTSEIVNVSTVAGLQVVDVPEMSSDEVRQHCATQGCGADLAGVWGRLIQLTTAGHPKLVQVRIAELSERGWPAPGSYELVAQSEGVETARQLARATLSSSVAPGVAEFVYAASEATFPLARHMLVSLGENVPGLVNIGDVIDSLTGKWLETFPPNRFQVTRILSGAAQEVWSTERRKLAHVQLYDAISGTRTLDVADAAALLFHAFVGEDSERLTFCIRLLHEVDSQKTSSAIYRQLLWVPHIGNLPGQRFFPAHPYLSAMLRSLQFSVATEVAASNLQTIVDRWHEEADALPLPELRNGMLTMLWGAVVSTRSNSLGLGTKLSAIERLSERSGQVAEVAEDGARKSIEFARATSGGIPDEATTSQFLFAMRAPEINSLERLEDLLDWLATDASPQARNDFEAVLRWPMVIAAGAFVHGAWANEHDSERDWAPVLEHLRRAYDTAIQFELREFGRQAAKAMSIVLGEHVGDAAAAVKILDDATQAFGSSGTLLEQRVNALFQSGDNAGALAFLETFLGDPQASQVLDAFAYRRVAISACRIERWDAAEGYFLAGAEAPRISQLETTKVGMVADACYVAALGGNPQRAARMLSDLMLELPDEAYMDGHEHWEAAIRAIATISKSIDAVASGIFDESNRISFGLASQPGLAFGEPQPHQDARTNHCVAVVGLLAARLGDVAAGYRARLKSQQDSVHFIVRHFSSKARLALELHLGTEGDFVDVLAFIERATNGLEKLRSEGGDVLGVDEGDVEPIHKVTPDEGWLTLIFAAAICCDDPRGRLGQWEKAVAARWGSTSRLAIEVAGIRQGLQMDPSQAKALVHRRDQRSVGETVGAALCTLRAGGLTPEATAGVQGLLASAVVFEATGVLFKSETGRPIARRFAPAWERYAASPFVFRSPRIDVPRISETLASVRRGEASLKRLLVDTASAVHVGIGDYLARLE